MKYLLFALVAVNLIFAQPGAKPKPAVADPFLRQPASGPCSQEPIGCATDENTGLPVSPKTLTIVPPKALPNCANLPPICAGVTSLLANEATPEQFIEFVAKYKVPITSQPMACRFQLPPKCGIQTHGCKQECQ